VKLRQFGMDARVLKSGVREYWIVDPRSRAVTVLAGPDWKQERLFGERDRLRSEVLPGLEVLVTEMRPSVRGHVADRPGRGPPIAEGEISRSRPRHAPCSKGRPCRTVLASR
jgi:hypothetical protein